MRRLALVSIIFLPITFVAGGMCISFPDYQVNHGQIVCILAIDLSLTSLLPVYGTNFEDFPELKHSISYFWIICGVVTAIVVRIFDLCNGVLLFISECYCC